jgi:hypothetical protein
MIFYEILDMLSSEEEPVSSGHGSKRSRGATKGKGVAEMLKVGVRLEIPNM